MWPERESLRKALPKCFRAKFGDKFTFDSFEAFIERPSKLLARHLQAPQYTLQVLSQMPGGGGVEEWVISTLTEHCGTLNNLHVLPGDMCSQIVVSVSLIQFQWLLSWLHK